MELHLRRGMRVPSHTAPGEVYLMVSEGECELTIEEEVNHLEAGDLFHFDGNRVHNLKAITNFKAFVVTTFPFTARKMIGNLLKKNLFKKGGI